jgi:hypothetical protein
MGHSTIVLIKLIFHFIDTPLDLKGSFLFFVLDFLLRQRLAV